MFDLDRFIEDCRAAAAEDKTHKAAREVLARALSDPDQVIGALGEPRKSQVQKLYADDRLTIANVVWAPWMTVMPHNHDMWAVIGIYGGREDNIFWRRIKDDPEGRIEAAGAKALATGEYAPLGRDIIHSVTNPIPKLTGALHIYGGDFFEAHRSEWDPEHLTERPLDIERVRAQFRD